MSERSVARTIAQIGVGFIGSDEVQLSGDCVQRRRQGSILVRLSLEQHVSLLRVRNWFGWFCFFHSEELKRLC